MESVKNSNLLIRTSVSPLAGMAFLFCAFLLFFILISFVTTLLMSKMANMEASIRIATLLQDIFVFILPAVISAMVMTRIPAEFLFIDKSPDVVKTVMAVVTLFVAMPFMDAIIQWNQGITFPESMKDLEAVLRESEDVASDFVGQMLGGAGIGSLVVSICIVAIMAALSEELFFRGALLRLFFQTRMNHHVAIWAVAIIFSLMHFQFFGFVPRMLLGAYFGYLVWWTRCLWIPVIVHAINNSVVVIAEWKDGGADIAEEASAEPVNALLCIGSLLLTALCIGYFVRNARDNDSETVDSQA